MIKLHFETLDGIRKTKRFKTLAGARKAAHEWVGKDATVGRWYAVSFDGVVKVMCEGCTVHDIWPGDFPTDDQLRAEHNALMEMEARAQEDAQRAEYEKLDKQYRPPRPTGCTCSDYQLIQVGCDCGAATRNDDIPF